MSTLPTTASRPTLSLCMIVKNEARTLERCLSTARPHVDEIVVVDTGSTDGTQEIARRYADVFDQIEWPNSFAIARNHSFDLGTCDFLMYLDGDEYISEVFHWKRIRRALRMPRLAAIQIPILNILPDGHVLSADRANQERVFRNHPSLRFFGSVHNQIQERLEEYVRATGDQVIAVEAEVTHTGYSLDTEGMKRKYQPRLELLIAEYNRPRSELYRAYYGYQLGVVYYVMEEWEGAGRLFGEIDYHLLTPQNAFYSHLLAVQTALRLKRAPAALDHASLMLATDRSEPIAYFSAGQALLQNGQVADSVMMFLEAFKVNDLPGASPRFMLNPAVVFEIVAQLCRRVGAHHYADGFSALTSCPQLDSKAAHALASALQAELAGLGERTLA